MISVGGGSYFEALGQEGPLLSQQCDLWGQADCQKWVFRSGHSSLGDEKEQSGLRAQVPPGRKASGISTVGMAQTVMEEKVTPANDFLCTEVRRGFPSFLLSTHARDPVIKEPQVSVPHLAGLTCLVVLRGSLGLSSPASLRPQRYTWAHIGLPLPRPYPAGRRGFESQQHGFSLFRQSNFAFRSVSSSVKWESVTGLLQSNENVSKAFDTSVFNSFWQV